MAYPVAPKPRVDGAIVVLGCGFSLDGERRLSPGALSRRVARAAQLFEAAGDGERIVVVASGGRAWAGVVEADAIRAELVRLGVPAAAIARERGSLSTRDNARYTAALLARRGLGRATLVTCDWHLDRALATFRRAGLEATGVPAPSGGARGLRRLWRWGRERLLSLGLSGNLASCLACAAGAGAALLACGRPASTEPPPTDAGASALLPPAASRDPAALARARAEDARRASAVPTDAARSHEAAPRREAARAFARILDADDAPLLRALDDDDDSVMAWGAYGLGESCRGKPEAHVAALAARLASLEPWRPVTQPIDARLAVLRALGRCAGEVAEQTLRAWLRRGAAPGTLDAAAYALGDVAARRGTLSLESSAALLDAAQRDPAVSAALYPFGRSDCSAGDELQPRLLLAARASLAHAGFARFFAVRALGRAGPDAADELARVLSSPDFTPPERAEAARGLARLRRVGQAGLAGGIAALVPAQVAALTSDLFGVLLTAVEAAGDDLPKALESALWRVTRLEAGEDASPALGRRVSQLRCAAATRLAKGAWDSDVLRGCDVTDGEAGDKARLAALDHGPLTRARRAAWLQLVHGKHVRVTEAALELIARHPELGDAALPVLAEALGSAAAGVVATAADVVHGHPDRMFVLAASEKRAALDPSAPPPTASPARDLDAGVARALRAALAHPWTEDLVETRLSLMDAALSVGLDEGRTFAQAACRDPNATLRARAAKALAAAGDKGVACTAPEKPGRLAPELDAPLTAPSRVVFDLDTGASLAVTFDPLLTPVAATRFVALARSGFYTGVVVHRVVPGFVVQLGDRGGDGYGGSGGLMRCETSPVGFGALDVGVALAGRDTGSSQFFVTLARHPHLDGEYARVGRASGDWDAVAEGDIVTAVHAW